MRIQRLFAYASAVCFISLLAGTATADDGSGQFNAFLKGKYQFIINQSCTTSDVAPGFIGVV